MCNHTSCAQVHELPQSHCGDNRRAHCFHDYIYVYYAHLASVRFEHSMCRGSLMTTYITLLALLVEHSLVHWYQQCVTVHHVPKCMSCHKAIVVITGRAHCFHDYIYIYIYYAHLASVIFEHSICRGSLMTTYITLLALLVEHSLVHWYQQSVTIHHVPKCMSCHKAIVAITGGHIVFMITYMYITLILLL